MLLLLSACRVEKLEETGQFNNLNVQIQCGPPGGSSQGDVFAVIQDYKVKITSIGNCQEIPFDSYDKTNIPDSALIAVGNKENLQVFAVQEGDDIHFIRSRKFALDEAWTYETIVTFTEGRYQFLLPVNPGDLTGLYYQEDPTQNIYRVFFLGLKDQQLEAQYFEMEGKIPDRKLLLRELALYPSVTLSNFYPDIEKLEFDSDLGKGMILLNQGSLNLLFLNKTDADGKKLLFRRLED